MVIDYTSQDTQVSQKIAFKVVAAAPDIPYLPQQLVSGRLCFNSGPAEHRTILPAANLILHDRSVNLMRVVHGWLAYKQSFVLWYDPLATMLIHVVPERLQYSLVMLTNTPCCQHPGNTTP